MDEGSIDFVKAGDLQDFLDRHGILTHLFNQLVCKFFSLNTTFKAIVNAFEDSSMMYQIC